MSASNFSEQGGFFVSLHKYAFHLFPFPQKFCFFPSHLACVWEILEKSQHYPCTATITADNFLASVISALCLSIHFNQVHNTMKHFQDINNQSSGDTSPAFKLSV